MSRWYQKPYLGVPIDFEHPYARDIIGCWLFNEGGGGTVAKFIAQHNMDVIDCGPAVLSMHSPFEISSKVDIYSCFEAYQAFLKGI